MVRDSDSSEERSIFDITSRSQYKSKYVQSVEQVNTYHLTRTSPHITHHPQSFTYGKYTVYLTVAVRSHHYIMHMNMITIMNMIQLPRKIASAIMHMCPRRLRIQFI